MFASNALPLPNSFGHEHRPLRLTAESARPQPQGECRYQNSPGRNSPCCCQSFQHDRRAPGNICDCGHSACYHSPASSARRLLPEERVITALAEKVKKLEESMIKQQESQHDELSRIRQLWDREARILREALSPFYDNEQDMRRYIADIEDKVDVIYDKSTQLQERVAAIDNAGSTLERRIRIWEETHCRKRKASIGADASGVMSPESNYTSASSTESDATSLSTNLSPQPPSPMHLPASTSLATALPRSSGVLHHRASSGNSCGRPIVYGTRQLYLSGDKEEPRSSGFLSIDLAERLRRKKLSPPEIGAQVQPVTYDPSGTQRVGPSKMTTGLPTPPQGRTTTGALPVSGLLSDAPVSPSLDARAPKKRKQQTGTMALDVLANASMARPSA